MHAPDLHQQRMRTDPAYRADASAERERCRQIVDYGLKAGGGSPLYRLALGLAFDTDMTAAAALKILERLPQVPEPERGPARVAVPTTDFAALMAKLGEDEVDPALRKEPETLDDVIAQARALEGRRR